MAQAEPRDHGVCRTGTQPHVDACADHLPNVAPRFCRNAGCDRGLVVGDHLKGIRIAGERGKGDRSLRIILQAKAGIVPRRNPHQAIAKARFGIRLFWCRLPALGKACHGAARGDDLPGHELAGAVPTIRVWLGRFDAGCSLLGVGA